MRRTVNPVKPFPGPLAAAILLAGLAACPALAQQAGQRTFPSAEAAGEALATAARDNDEKAMIEILGPDGKQIVSSGDAAEDALDRAQFVERYLEMHRLAQEPDGAMVLYVGARNWPTPIPIVTRSHSWFFDTEAGRSEILARRVGQNEASALGVCLELVAAQQEFHAAGRNEYAQLIFSDPGQHNGLYWKTADGEPQSPIGPLVAAAAADGDGRIQATAPIPYRGYFFRILTGQGKNSRGGARSYLVHGRMTKGFAFVAYPAHYRSSGVMTFIVSRNGEMYQQDLGPDSAGLAQGMKDFNPGPRWRKAED